MWFPYSLPTTWKVEGDRQRANESNLDKYERDFLVAFQLRNPVSKEWSVELQLQEGRSVQWNEPSGNLIDVHFFPNDDGRLAEVVCKLTDTGMYSAVERSHAPVRSYLDFWSGEYGRGFSVAGLRVADLKHDARWRVMPHWPSALDLQFEIPDILPADFWSAAQIYREGRNSTSDRYRFLCCYTLLGKWARAEKPFDWVKQEPTHGLERAEIQISKQLLALAGAGHFLPASEGKAFSELLEILAPWHAKATAFCIEGLAPEKDEDFRALQEWAAVANLTDIAAHTILSKTIAYWRNKASVENKESGEAEMLAQSVT